MVLQLDFQNCTPSSLVIHRSHIRYGTLISDILSQHSYVGITSLDLDLSPRIVRGVPAPFLPPFADLPNLEDLTLSPICDWPVLKLLEVPDGVRIPALRSLTMRVEFGDWHLVSGWVVALLARLKQQGDLDKFKLLNVHELYETHHKVSDLEGAIHDYLPEHKIVLKVMED